MSEIREITSLPLARSIIDLLLKHGFRYVSDFQGLKPLDLCQEVKSLPPHTAMEVLHCIEKSSSSISSSVFTSTSTSLPAPLSSPSPSSPSIGTELLLSSNSHHPHHTGSSQLTAKELLLKMGIHRPLITFCREMDTMLGGGVMMGQITEFCGVPGIGKTQLAIQLALDIQIPEVFNGNGGEALYIDTEGSFLPERAAEMASELSSHLIKLSRIQQQNKTRSQEILLGQLAAAENMTMERFLEGICLFRCHDQAELLAAIHHLPTFLRNKTRIKVIIIDSIAFHFRSDLQDLSTRNRVLSQLVQLLNQLAYESKLAIVLINHVTTKIVKNVVDMNYRVEGEVDLRSSTNVNKGGKKDESVVNLSIHCSWCDVDLMISDGKRLIPALGEQWAHCVTNRVLLHWQQPSYGQSQEQLQRCATLVKSPSMPPKTVYFAVTARGVRDLPSPPPSGQSQTSIVSQHGQQQPQQQQHQSTNANPTRTAAQTSQPMQSSSMSSSSMSGSKRRTPG